MNTTDLFKNRFDVSEINDFGAVSDSIITMANRARTILLLITDLIETTERADCSEIGCIYAVIEELHDIQDLTTAYREHIKQQTTTPNNESAARLREFAKMIVLVHSDLDLSIMNNC